ncbi:hypothetical protein BWI17_22300 [Betaproteobacteria bacterium GR16-43]|nr:hypothetical protein BWI17_22300 [Betaproteobacteria bacterium GR16-43]
MDCPFCPDRRDARPPSRVSPWAPLALIVAVLTVASFFSSASPDRRDGPDRRDMTENRMAIPGQGRAL